MHLISLSITLAAGLSSAATIIPKTVFDSTSSLTQYFSYNYPWGTDHNGGARMAASHAVISTAGTLTLTAQKISSQPPATHGGKQIPISYLSGAVSAKQHFTIPSGGGFIFSGSFQATTTKGMARFLAHGNVGYASPGSFHYIKCQVRDRGNGKDAQVKYFLNDVEVTTHYGKDYVGKPLYLIINLQMEGSSGTPGPSSKTSYSIRNMEVTTL
ncbi:hypothetical protein PMIN03_008931 [Paraphaeosphaeria minitans]